MSRAGRFLRIFIVVAALMGIAAGGIFTVLGVRHDAARRVATDLTQKARAAAAAVDAVGGDLTRSLRATDLAKLRRATKARQWDLVIPYLREILVTHDGIASIALYDSKGFLVFRYPLDRGIMGRRFSTQEYFSAARTSPTVHISKIFVGLGRPKVVVIAFSRGIRYANAFWGAIVITTPAGRLDGVTAPFQVNGTSLNVYDAAGERISPSSGLSARSYADDPSVGRALHGASGIRDGTTSMEAYEPVPSTGWAVVASRPLQLRGDQIHDVTVRYGAIAAALLAFAIVAVFATRSLRNRENPSS